LSVAQGDALVILRRLADRDPEWARVIETIAKDLLSAVDAGDVAAKVLAELESLSAENVWDRAGPWRDGYSAPLTPTQSSPAACSTRRTRPG
jgi:hypothetical protein